MRMSGKNVLAVLSLSAVLATAAEARVIGTMTAAEPLTEARIATLPAAQQPAWTAYLARSKQLQAADKASLLAERAGKPGPASPSEATASDGGMPLNRPADWYAGAEARHIADNVVSFQTPAGGWGKNQDHSGPLRQPGQLWVVGEPGAASGPDAPIGHYVGTIDNGSTISELRFLARVQAQLPGKDGDAYRESFGKGVRYLLTAQYPNGGWPQIFPVEGGYHDAVTFNDDAITNTISLLQDAGNRKGDYGFVPAPLAAEARAAVARATDMILVSQVVIGGKRTAWGQQHDTVTLAPAGARNFEPTSLSSAESAKLLDFLMRQPDPSPQMVAAVHAGVAWLRSVALYDVAWPSAKQPDGKRLTAQTGAGPLWSRYYDMATMKPVFGDRDKTIHDDVNELSLERRNGYAWFGTAPVRTLQTFETWSRDHPQPK